MKKKVEVAQENALQRPLEKIDALVCLDQSVHGAGHPGVGFGCEFAQSGQHQVYQGQQGVFMHAGDVGQERNHGIVGPDIGVFDEHVEQALG